jgi:hypothetical protein
MTPEARLLPAAARRGGGGGGGDGSRVLEGKSGLRGSILLAMTHYLYLAAVQEPILPAMIHYLYLIAAPGAVHVSRWLGGEDCGLQMGRVLGWGVLAKPLLVAVGSMRGSIINQCISGPCSGCGGVCCVFTFFA